MFSCQKFELPCNEHLSKKHANLTMNPATISSMAMYLHERDYVKNHFDNLDEH